MKYVLCVGMYRSCSTWQYDVVSHLVETRLGGVRIGFVDGDEFAARRAKNREDARVEVLKYHDAQRAFGDAIKAGEAIAIYGYRDMRDVAFSYLHKASIPFDEMVRSRFLEKVIRNDNFWRAQPGLLCQRYEAILADEVQGVNELAWHIGVTLSEAQALKLADEYSWQSNFRRTLEVRRNLEAKGLDLKNKENSLHQDPLTLLHWNHLRSRRSTSWRDLSSVAQRETLAHLCGDWLIEHGYETDRSWVVNPRRPGPDSPDGQPQIEVRRRLRTHLPSPSLNRWRLRDWLKSQGRDVSGRKASGG